MKPLNQFDEHDLIKWDSQQEWNQLCGLLNSLGYKWGSVKYSHDLYGSFPTHFLCVGRGFFRHEPCLDSIVYKAKDILNIHNSLFNEII